MRKSALLLVLMLAACGKPASDRAAISGQPVVVSVAPVTDAPASDAPAAPASSYPPVEPRAPGTPGGLPDDRTPISEAPFTPTSAQGAANAMQTYFALIGQKQYAAAYALWDPGSPNRPPSLAAFSKTIGGNIQYDAQVGAPGQPEGAAGSSYVDVPLQVYGRRADGAEFHSLGKATLRRVNDVPGSTAEQRLWHISNITLQ